jgi:chromosomal replication initiation ATPase DnaA
MARKPRLHVPGGLYHVRLRGNGGQDIFFDDEDRYHLYLLILEQVLGKRIHPTPKISLDKIMTYVSAEYGVNEEELREPPRNRVVCEARAVIDWLSWRLESSSITDVAIYFQRESSTFSRHIGKIDAKAKNSDKLRDRLNGYIKH